MATNDFDERISKLYRVPPAEFVSGSWRSLSSVLSTAAAVEVGSRLRAAGDEHPWTSELPGHLLGSLPGQRSDVDVERTTLGTVVEIEVGTAFDRGRWRHPVRYRRLRPDLDPATVTVGHLRRL